MIRAVCSSYRGRCTRSRTHWLIADNAGITHSPTPLPLPTQKPVQIYHPTTTPLTHAITLNCTPPPNTTLLPLHPRLVGWTHNMAFNTLERERESVRESVSERECERECE